MSYLVQFYRYDLGTKKIVEGSYFTKEYKRFNNAFKVAAKVAQQAKDIFDLPADIPDEFRPTNVMMCVISPYYDGCTSLRTLCEIHPDLYVSDKEERSIQVSVPYDDDAYYFMDYYQPIKTNEQFHMFLKRFNEFRAERGLN